MSVTIRDVAKAANVSPSTVSRVISDSPSISDKTKKKVQKVMAELGYHMNYNARNLAQQSTKTIGIVVKHSTQASMYNTFFPEVIAGISALCSKYDFSISLTTGESEEEIFNDTVKMVRGKRVDGMIVLYSKEDDKVVPYLVECDIPFVVIGKPVYAQGKITYVDNNNVEAAKSVTEYLFGLGHHRVGFIGEGTEFEVGEARLNGYLQAISGSGQSVNKDYVKNLNFDAEEGRKIVDELLSLKESPTALVVANDLNALIVLTALSERDIKVPTDISVVAFNNTLITQVSHPPLTTVETHIFQLGYEAANCILELVNEPSTFNKNVIIPTLLVERKSCLPI